MYKKILVIKLGAIGDVIYTTPALRALKKKFPDSLIYYLTAKWSKIIAQNIPYVDSVFTMSAAGENKNIFGKILESVKMIRNIKKEKFDAVVVFHRSTFSNLFAFLCRIPVRAGFSYKGKGRFLTHTVLFDSKKHEVERYLDVVKEIGAKPDGTRTELKIPKDELNNIYSIFNINKITTHPIVAIHAAGGANPGTFMPIKRWEKEKFAKLADLIIDKYRANVLFIGDKSDRELTLEIMGLMKNKPVNLTGETSISELIGLLGKCDIIIGGDSGPLHIAAAVGTAAVFLFGPSDPKLVAPAGEKYKIIWKQISCSPCYTPDTVLQNINFSKCPSGTHECMKSISVEEVLKAVDDILRCLAKS